MTGPKSQSYDEVLADWAAKQLVRGAMGRAAIVPPPPDGPCYPAEEQVGGDHYRRLTIQPITFIMENGLGYCEGNVVKYVSRWRAKGGLEDLKKARQYLDFLIDQEENV